MPYNDEFAHYKPLRRLVDSKRVNELLHEYEIREARHVEETPLEIYDVEELPTDNWQPDWVLAIDGSQREVPVTNGYPGAEACYITVASVLIDLAKIRQLDGKRPFDPQEFRTVEQSEALDCALPGSNVVYKGEISAKSSLRRALFEILASEKLADEESTLLDTYEALLAYKPTNKSQTCPCEDCPDEDTLKYHPKTGIYQCLCDHQHDWYSTDALRIHERMNPIGSNGLVFSEVMQVLERLWLIHILRVFEAMGYLSILKRMAIVIDGALAVFGQPAWLSSAIYKELTRINQEVRKATGQDILLLGIEKTGAFVEHFQHIDIQPDGSNGRFPKGAVALFSDEYIKKCIVFSEGKSPYGYQTYFGRKFAYKTKSGARIVGSVPFLDETHKNLTTALPSQYPRLADALHMLDNLASSRYENAVMPIISAHAEASIPLHLGGKVLERLAREIINGQR